MEFEDGVGIGGRRRRSEEAKRVLAVEVLEENAAAVGGDERVDDEIGQAVRCDGDGRRMTSEKCRFAGGRASRREGAGSPSSVSCSSQVIPRG